MPSPQARYWILTIPHPDFLPYLPPQSTWIKGQLEEGEGGYLHWQVVVAFTKKIRLAGLKQIFGTTAHCEPTRSEAAEEYVHKEETRVAGTQFELGAKLMKRNAEADWDKVWDDAKAGNLMLIPADVRIRAYHTLKRIRKDFEEAPMRDDIRVNVFYGVTGSGKSHRMFQEAYSEGITPYVKSSTTKWWDGYQGQERVIIDEFRGQISIEHLLKWCDKYPCFVEEKGGQVALKATKIWICSNLPPVEWYPGVDTPTRDALLRRLNITRFENPFGINLNQNYY